MSTYEMPENKWFTHDLEMNIVSACTKIAHANDRDTSRRLIALSKEGEVDVFASGDYVWRTEKIPEAGLRLGTRGWMTHIRQIGSHLFACGQNGQVYQRHGSDDWRKHDEGVYKFETYTAGDVEAAIRVIGNRRTLNCIDGNSETDIYVAGDNGYLAHHDGKKWTQLKLKTGEHLQWVRCYGADEVYVCGYNGTLLKGSAKLGFKDVSSVNDNFTWWCLARPGEHVYLCASEGLFYFDGKTIKKVKTGLKPEHQDTGRVDVAGGVLWSVGAKDIVRRLADGKWERIHHVDNERIGK